MIDISISSLRESLELVELIYKNPDLKFPPKLSEDYRFKYKSRQHLVHLSIQCNWLIINAENQLLATERGLLLINQKSEKIAFRNQMYDVVNMCKPKWASNLMHGRVESMEFVPDAIRDIFITIGLYDPLQSSYDDEAILWWDKIATSYYSFRDEYNTRIGRIGEKLTMYYEQKRTNIKPKWKSIESDRLGYDILSIVSKKDQSLLCIEVKTSTSKNLFKFTKNEKALLEIKDSKGYRVYFWRLHSKDKAELTILKKEDLVKKFPKNSKAAHWELCEFNLDEFPDKKNIKTKVIKPSDIDLKQFALAE